MRIVILQNHSSGRGNAGDSIRSVVAALQEAGMIVQVISVGPGVDPEQIQAAVKGAAALVLAGGDGTVHHALPIAIRTGVPIYQLPFGTENLFAREFSMSDSPQRLIEALRASTITSVDVGLCNQRPFSLMCSVGFDANVVQRLAAQRTGAISRFDYAAHGIKELLDPRPSLLTVHVNDVPLVRSQSGLVVVANSRHYGGRFNPAPWADIRDGVFDIAFFPHSSSAQIAVWGVRALLGIHTSSDELIQARGTRVRILSNQASAFQLDGEHAGSLIPGESKDAGLTIDMQPAALRVLSSGEL